MTKITERELKNLAPGTRLTDELIEGFVARCLPSGKVSFGYQYTDKATGARRWMGIGLHGAVTVDEARTLAKKYAGARADHRDPAAELKTKIARSENTVNHVLDAWLDASAHLRSIVSLRQTLAKHVRPVIGSKVIYPPPAGDLERGDIMRMIDGIAKEYPRQAQMMLAHLRTAFNWWQLRDEKFHTPIIKGMVKDKTVRRERVLTNEELHDIWRALDEIKHVPDTFPAFVKVLFLTACRRCEVADMHTSEINGATWTIPAARYKTGKDHVVPLIPAIKKLLPKTFGFVFGCAHYRAHQGAGSKPLKGFGKFKTELDAAIAAIRRREGRGPMPAWTFHDLRRSARTLLAELKIDSDTAERVLGHTKGGIEETYNRHKYLIEKTDALTKLAAHVELITKRHAPAPAAKLRLVGR